MFALTQKSHSAVVCGEGGGEESFANSLAQGQHYFLMDTKALHKIAEALPKYTNNPGECTVEDLKNFFKIITH